MKPRSVISKQEIIVRNEEIVSAIKSGAFIEDIAEKHAMTPRAVKSVCQINGIPTAGRWRTTKVYRQKRDEFGRVC